MTIKLADSAAALEQCFPIMVQLRPHLHRDEFLQQVARQQAAGYHIAYIEVEQNVQAVAGFRISENLAWGKFLYIDDLVTDEAVRSHGYGGQLLTWIADYAHQQGCTQLHLDSGVIRYAAHKFYLNQGFIISGYHFFRQL